MIVTLKLLIYLVILLLTVAPINQTMVEVRARGTFTHSLYCSAVGDPEPELQWVDVDAGEAMRTGSRLRAAIIEGQRNFECRATNRGGTVRKRITVNSIFRKC